MKHLILLFILCLSSYARDKPEKFYQEISGEKLNGKIEVRLSDKTRIDILTETEAIEVDFADKWAEGIGQALHYSTMTELDAGLILILEKETDEKYLDRVLRIIKIKSLRIILWKLQNGKLIKVN